MPATTTADETSRSNVKLFPGNVRSDRAALERPRASETWVSVNLGQVPATSSPAPPPSAPVPRRLDQSGSAALERPRASETLFSVNLDHRPGSSGSKPCCQSGCAALDGPRASETWVSTNRDRKVAPPRLLHAHACLAPERARVVRHLDRLTDSVDFSEALRSEPPPRFRAKAGSLFLELFSGVGGLSASLRRQGIGSASVEILQAEYFDLCCSGVQGFILSLIRSGHVWGVHLGTPCTIWSISRTRVNDNKQNRNKERIGRSLAIFSAAVARTCHSCGVPFSIENPLSSKIWRFAPMLALHALQGVYDVVFDACAYEGLYKKPTKILTSFQCLQCLSRRCPGNHVHIQCQGSVKVFKDGKMRSVNRTKLAGAYVQPLCHKWSKALRCASPATAARPDGIQVRAFQEACAIAHRAGAEKAIAFFRSSVRGVVLERSAARGPPSAPRSRSTSSRASFVTAASRSDPEPS